MICSRHFTLKDRLYHAVALLNSIFLYFLLWIRLCLLHFSILMSFTLLESLGCYYYWSRLLLFDALIILWRARFMRILFFCLLVEFSDTSDRIEQLFLLISKIDFLGLNVKQFLLTELKGRRSDFLCGQDLRWDPRWLHRNRKLLFGELLLWRCWLTELLLVLTCVRDFLLLSLARFYLSKEWQIFLRVYCL